MKDFCRFLFYSRDYREASKQVRHEALMPFPHDELSVSKILGMGEVEIWNLGDQVGSGRGLPAKARGEFTGQDVTGSGLNIVEADPRPWHYHIVGWEKNDKAKQKLQAQMLAPKLDLVMRNASREYLDGLIDKASKSWEDVDNPDKWLNDLRSGDL